MCGVGGFLRGSKEPSSFHVEELRKMSLALAHRGPDGENFFSDRNFSVFHRLLRIHSPLTMPGPYTSADNNWVLSFNGEIYNHEHLRKHLDSSRPRQWKYNTDAEIFLEGWAQQGESFLNEVNGMFAFALWNKKERQLILGRDRLGQKPLYYTSHKSTFFFASEVKAFKAIGLPMALNETALNDYWAYRYVPGPETLFKNIYKLQPGHLLIVNEDIQTRTIQYWHPNKNTNKLQPTEKEEQLFTLLKDAHQLCVKNVVSPQLFLSGGVDSSTVASFIPSQAQALYFSSPRSADEYSFAAETARHFGHSIKTVTLQESEDEILKKAIWSTEEPLGDSILIPTYVLAQAARAHSRVVLSGEGADEIFAGYLHHVVFYQLARLRRRVGAKGAALAARILKDAPLHKLSHLTPYGSKILPKESSRRISRTLLSLAENNSMGSALTTISDVDLSMSARAQQENQVHGLKDLMSLDLATWLPDYTLTRLDKIMMSQGVEARLPFLDHRLVEFTFSLNEEDFIRGLKNKWILRKAMQNHLGKARAWRKKTAFVFSEFGERNILDDKMLFAQKTLQIWREQFGIVG